MLVDVSKIKTGRNYRRDFSDIIELAQDIKDHGLLQPLVINQEKELLAGERRLRAVKYLEWSQVECNVIEATEQAQDEITLVENLQRSQTNPIEDGTAFKAYIKKHKTTYTELAKKLHLTADFISERIKLLSLIKDAQILVSDGVMPIYMGLAMSRLTSEKQSQIIGYFDFNNLPGKKVFEQFCRDFADSNASVDETFKHSEKEERQNRLTNIVAGFDEDDLQEIMQIISNRNKPETETPQTENIFTLDNVSLTEKIYGVQCVYKNSFANPVIIERLDDEDLVEGDMVFSHLEVVELTEKDMKYLRKRSLPAIFTYEQALGVLEHVDPYSDSFPSYKTGKNEDGSNRIFMCAPRAYVNGPIFSDMF